MAEFNVHKYLKFFPPSRTITQHSSIMVTTRPGNADVHPGNIVKSTMRKSREEVIAERKAKQAAKEQKAKDVQDVAVALAEYQAQLAQEQERARVERSVIAGSKPPASREGAAGGEFKLTAAFA